MLIKKGKRTRPKTYSLWECDICRKHFEMENSDAREAVNKESEKTCSKECLFIWRKIKGARNVLNWCEKNPLHLMTKGCGITTDGYVWIYKKGNHNNQIKLHRYLMEIKLNRQILPSEIVHHIDGIKLNNVIENLQLTTISEHNKIHKTLNRENRKDAWSDNELKDVLLLSRQDFCKTYPRTNNAYFKKRNTIKLGNVL